MRLAAALSLASLLVALPLRAERDPAAEQAALGVLDEFLAAFNARDAKRMAATLHFPHVRFASGRVAIFPDAAAFASGMEFDRFVKDTSWHHSRWDERRVVQSGQAKVHVAVRFTRFREDGSVIASYDSLYVVTKADDGWGIQARSSFAP
jgi:hypothetical protein